MMHSHVSFDPAIRGLHMIYRPNEVNHCPGCGRTHWYLGNTTAECAFCATALPYAGETSTGKPEIFTRFTDQGAARGRFVINGRAA